MTHTYTITGMSCNGCRTKAEKALNELDGVEAVVTLDPPTAAIASEKRFPFSNSKKPCIRQEIISLAKAVNPMKIPFTPRQCPAK